MKPKDWMKKVFLTNASVVSENTPTEKRRMRPVYQLDCGICFVFVNSVTMCFCILLILFPRFSHASEDNDPKAMQALF